MGKLEDGQWIHGWFKSDKKSGTFIRPESQFRHWVTADGESGFVAESGRYHLYISLACPWAHRALIVRTLKGLESAISLSVVDPVFDNEDWAFTDADGDYPDHANGYRFMHEVYLKADHKFSGMVTVPTLWDRQQQTVVNNESSEIIRMFNSAFNAVAERPELDLYPEALRNEIDSINDFVYDNINNGVYKSGFAVSQTGYEKAVTALFDALEQIEQRLAGQRYLVGEQITEADWRLFTTLVRFDSVYVGHFKCNIKRLIDFPNLWAYTRDLYQMPGIAETVSMDHIKRHYYMSHVGINPNRVVPVGPDIDFTLPHGRGD